jgi:hypothetical protein
MFFNCQNLKLRHKNKQPYFYCKSKNNIITKNDCENCSQRILEANKPISKISSKRRKLEKYRDNKLIKIGKCENCGKYCEHLDSHEVYGGCNRKRSIENGFVALLCRECHSNEYIIAELKKKYQKEYEIDHTRQQFIDIIGKSYL